MHHENFKSFSCFPGFRKNKTAIDCTSSFKLAWYNQMLPGLLLQPLLGLVTQTMAAKETTFYREKTVLTVTYKKANAINNKLFCARRAVSPM